MRRRLRALLLLGCAACGGDGACGPAPPKGELPAHEPGESVGPGPVAVRGPAAFDLVATGAGALLVHAPPEGGLVARTLDGRGTPVGAPKRLVAGARVAELAAAASRGRVALLYVDEAAGAGGEVRRVVVDPDALAPSPPEALAAGVRASDARGHLALAVGPGGELGALFRAEDGPCHEGPVCARFAFRRLEETGTERRGVGLATASPCARPLVGYVQAGGVWFYGLCIEEGGVPRTVVYAIQFEPRYAVAAPALPGARPRGLATLGSAAVLVAERNEGPVASVFPSATEAPRPLGPGRELACDATGPALAVGEMRVPLGEVSGDLGALLPPRLAPAASRAVWTGEVLLVAVVADGTLRVRRHRCAGGALQALKGG